jgi:alpha-tubulin suppressor-like RCC1 family protein
MNAIRLPAVAAVLLIAAPASARRDAMQDVPPAPVAASDQWRCAAIGGQLSCSRGDPRAPEVLSPGLSAAERVSVGPTHGCAVAGGVVSCWKDGAQAAPLALQDVVDATVGGKHSCAVTGDGKVWCWGENEKGQLGTPGWADHAEPARVPGVSHALAVRAGNDFTCALRDDGDVWCWGADITGTAKAGAIRTPPHAVVSGASAMDAGFGRACAVVNGGVTCWGHLPSGTAVRAQGPVPVDGIEGAVSVTVGYDHACALGGDGKVSCWGRGEFGRLGNGACSDSDEPVAVEGLSGVTALDASATHTCATTADGVYCWGGNWSGRVPDRGEPAPCDPEVAKPVRMAP